MLLIDNVDVTDIVVDISYKTKFNNGPAQLVFEYPVKKAVGFRNGSTVIFIYKNTNIFYGWLFKSMQSKDVFKCICYDQLRYLKSSNTFMRQIQTLDTFVNDVCAQIGDRIRLGKLDKTELKLGKYLFDNKTHLDMLYQSIKDNLLINGYLYCLRDHFGAIDLLDVYDLRLPLVIGDESLATDFEYTNSIDDDTYNYIKVAKDDEKKGVRDVYVAKNDKGIETFGKLMLYDKVDADLNQEQLKARAERLLKLKNQETETLSVECMGDLRVMAGNGVKIEIKQANLNLWAIVENATHEFKKEIHTMKLDLTFGRFTNA